MSRILSHSCYEQLKSLAADLVEDYALCYPLDPFEIAAMLGIHVKVHEFGMPPVAWFCATSDGYTVSLRSANGPKYQIHLNGRKPLRRQRFTLMHEIAHVWLDHLCGDGLVDEEREEAEANFLASYLLAPDQLVLEWVPVLTVADIAQEFQVSKEAAHLIHDRVLRRLNTAAGRRDYEKRIASSAGRRLNIDDVISARGMPGSA